MTMLVENKIDGLRMEFVEPSPLSEILAAERTVFAPDVTAIAAPQMIHLLNWGMGVESTWLLVDWIKHPENRPPGLTDLSSQLVVLVAQTKREFNATKQHCEQFVLPLLREHNIRLAQVGKAGVSKRDGYVVLGDTQQPYDLHTRDDRIYGLNDSFETDGWTQRVNRPHICAQRWKGEVLDAWIADHILPSAFGPYLGYNRDETKRVKDALDYGCHGERYIYPLVERDISRQRCLDDLFTWFGVMWHKSCCEFCPFQTKDTAIAHYAEDPMAALYAMRVEFISMAMNPRMLLFERRGVRDICKLAGIEWVTERFLEEIKQQQWAIYKVRRVYRHTGKRVDSARSVVEVAHGDLTQMSQQLNLIALDQKQATEFDDYHYRVYTHRRGEGYPAIEGFYQSF